jgi:hypothetical protein
MRSTAMLLAVLGVFVLLPSGHAWAYLDPGTGAMMTQVIIGAIAVGLVTIRSWWHYIKGLFARVLTGRTARPLWKKDRQVH